MRHKRLSNLILVVLCLLLAISVAGCGSDAKTPAATSAAPTSTATAPPTSGAITVLSDSIKADFPQSLTFNLEVESGSLITGIELRYKVVKVTSPSAVTTIKPDFTSGRKVQTSWYWDTRKASLPPGAEIEYYWKITDAAQDSHKTDSKSFTFDDTRYSWHEITEEKVRLFWYRGDDNFAQALMDAAQKALDKLAQDTGAQLMEDAKIYVYGSSDDLQKALVYSQDWTGGIAFTGYGITAIGIVPDNLSWGKGTVAHELTHLVIDQMTYNPYSELPTWLNEGLAMYVEGELEASFLQILAKAISSDALLSVRSLSSAFPAGDQQARLAYAESYTLVKFLIDQYSSSKMLDLLETFRKGTRADDALLAVYGFDVSGLNRLWRDSLGQAVLTGTAK